MRRYVLAVAGVGITFSALAQIRIEWPWGGEWSPNVNDILRIVRDPVSFAVPTGVPTQSSLTQFVISNPDKLVKLAQDPRYAAYIPIADAMIEGRNAVVANGGRKVPDHVRKALAGFFPDELIDSVRWTTNWNLVKNTLQTAQMFANKDTEAITLLNAVVFRDSRAADNVVTWAHELHHVQQYTDWGVLEFAKNWVNNSSVTGPVEQPAYDRARQIADVLKNSNIALSRPIATAADCSQLNASMAVCDLYVANNSSSTIFSVHGTARAKGDGTKSGSMALLLMHSGSSCNSDTQAHNVDNETFLQGNGFNCDVKLQPGQTKRVLAVAPNNRADAVSTTLNANWSVPQASTSAPVAIPAPRKSTTGSCTNGISTAYCNLTAGDGVSPVSFIVSGSARATSDGTNSGAMSLVMSTNAGSCNAGAGTVVGVDNATELRGQNYICRITVSPGQTVQVNLSAPNKGANAEWTRASVTW